MDGWAVPNSEVVWFVWRSYGMIVGLAFLAWGLAEWAKKEKE